MMSRPAILADFIDRAPDILAGDEELELIIAGDFIDFLAIEPNRCWTPDPLEAVTKLRKTTVKPPFDVVFAALAKFVASGHGLTILLGNHDVELALPDVQDALLSDIGATRRQVLFFDDGRAYRVGKALIEHGNRYDGANENDWDGLRAIASAHSRNEAPKTRLKVSFGSQIVERVVCLIKRSYPFIDLLQPQGELVALLLLAFEPSLIWNLRSILQLHRADLLQRRNAEGLQPGETRHVAFSSLEDGDDTDLKYAFGPVYERLRRTSQEVGLRDVVAAAWSAREDSLTKILDRGDRIPQERLQQIRVVMRRLLLDDESARLDGETGPYGKAAERLIELGKGRVQTVVMGHTHLAREIGPPGRASYINTGTWADVVRVPAPILEEGADRELEDFLRKLKSDIRPPPVPTYAELCIEPGGDVSLARLGKVEQS